MGPLALALVAAPDSPVTSTSVSTVSGCRTISSGRVFGVDEGEIAFGEALGGGGEMMRGRWEGRAKRKLPSGPLIWLRAPSSVRAAPGMSASVLSRTVPESVVPRQGVCAKACGSASAAMPAAVARSLFMRPRRLCENWRCHGHSGPRRDARESLQSSYAGRFVLVPWIGRE